MNKIDQGYDNLLGSNYELYAINLSELKELARSWYKGIIFREFDERHINNKIENDVVEMKKTGIVCNFFFAYKENKDFYLLDGFNRLFTDYGNLDVNQTVYLKILVDELKDNQLMKVMFHLNMWKLQKLNWKTLDIELFIDRGFKLFLYKKYGVEFYKREKQIDIDVKYDKDNYQRYIDRPQNSDDIELVKHYFIDECALFGNSSFKLSDISKLLSHKNIITDIIEIISENKYKTPPFKNFEMFFKGFIMFLAWRRASGDESEYKFQTYLDKLHEDKKFFKKLQGMSGTDSTRINIYHFFRELK